MSDWVVVKDLNVRHLYRCPECGQKETVPPNYFESCGTPVCDDCGGYDMEYVRTEVRNVCD